MKRPMTVRGMTSAMVISAVVLVPGLLWGLGIAWPGKEPLPPSVSAIQSLSDLATARVRIADVIEGENAHWRGRWSLHGELVLGVDLSKVAYVRQDAGKREAVLKLPRPHLISAGIDHERSEELYMKSLSIIGFSDRKVLRDEVWKMAGRKLRRLAEEPGYAERAKVQAERVLQKLFKDGGWTVTCEWE